MAHHGPMPRTRVPFRMAGPCAVVLATGAALVLTGVLAAPASADDAGLSSLLSTRLHNPRLGSDVAFIVTDAATGRVLARRNATSPQLPASNMKLVTAVNALTVLGADTRFTTRVRSGATPSDIVLQGGGDPLLTSAELTALARRVAAALPAGTPVTVHADTSLFPPAQDAPGWRAAYIPEVVSPVTALARIGDYSRDPSGRTVSAFAAALTKAGIPAVVGAPATASTDATTLGTTPGHTVVQDVARMLSESENNVAEVLFRQVALASGHPATWQGGSDAALATLSGLGLHTTGLALADGSGLSRQDRLTPAFLADLVRYARVTHPAAYASMFADGALPLAGQTGTLARKDQRFVTPHSRCAAGKVRAKTGTLFDTIGLSGIADSPAGERIFSILVNHRPQSVPELATRQAVDGLVATIVGCWAPR